MVIHHTVKLFPHVSTLLGLLVALSTALSPARAQTTTPPVYPGVSAVKPLFDLPLVAPGVWPNGIITQSGTCQIPLRMMRNCSFLKLIYANSTNGEPWGIVPNSIAIRASIIVLRPGKPASLHQVTFNGGNVEVTLDKETLIVSDKVPEYWDVTENAKAYVRTYVRMPTSTGKIPIFTHITPLTGEGARWVGSTTAPQDLTMAPWPTAAFSAVPETHQPYYPVAVIGDADPTLPSVAFIGSSSTASLDGFAAVSLNALKIPYIVLSTGGWTIWRYDVANLRSRVDASCTHIIEQFGRNDLGETYNPSTPVSQYLDPIKTRMTHLWQRHKLQGSWVAQVTIQPRVYTAANYTNPAIQQPYAVEQPLRQPLNAWIRDQVTVSNTPLDYVYEMGDMLEYFDNGVRTNRWKFGLNSAGTAIALTVDGLHANTNGVNLLTKLFSPAQFAYDSRDWIAPCLSSAIVPQSGAGVVLAFNEAKSPPLQGISTHSGFSVLVNGESRPLYRAELSGPKEVTLWLSGKPLRAGDIVRVGYAANPAAPVTDSSPLANALVGFANESAWNNSIMTGSETSPLLTIAGISVQRVDNQLEVAVTLSNKGGTEAGLVEITAATLNNGAASTPLPLRVGGIAPQGTQTVTLRFPDTMPGSRVVLRLTAKHTQGSGTLSGAVTVP